MTPDRDQIIAWRDALGFEDSEIVELFAWEEPREPLSKGKKPRLRWKRLTADALANDKALQWIEKHNAAGFSIAAGVGPRRSLSARSVASAEDVLHLRAMFADFDDVTPDEAVERIKSVDLPAPSMLISSGGGVHAYWRLRQPVADGAAWSEAQAQLVGAINADAAVKDFTRKLRLPGTMNAEHDAMARIVGEVDQNAIFELEELANCTRHVDAQTHRRVDDQTTRRVDAQTDRRPKTLSSLSLCSILNRDYGNIGATAREAILRSVVTAPGTRHRQTLELSRVLKAVLPDFHPLKHVELFRAWLEAGKDHIRADWEEAFGDFCQNPDRITHPSVAGGLAVILARGKQRQPPAIDADVRAVSEGMADFLILVRELAIIAAENGEREIFFAQGRVGRLLGVRQQTVSAWTDAMMNFYRVLRLVRPYDKRQGLTNRYEYLGELPPPEGAPDSTPGTREQQVNR